MRPAFQPGKLRGVTLTELLVVVVIVSLLATIAVPVYVTKAEQARIAIAHQEVRELARAQEACAIAHGFYIPLQMLDNNVDIVSSSAISDDLRSEDQTLFLIYATRDVRDQVGRQAALGVSTGSPHYTAVNRLRTNWQGPFMNFNRAAFREDVRRGEKPREYIRYGFPLDPWGNPYRFYSPIGIIGSNALSDYYTQSAAGSAATVVSGFSDGLLTTRDANRFDRFAIVSFGPNGLTAASPGGQPTDDDDDIIHLFGGIYTETSFRSPF